jgi:hypothetical protein
MSQQTSSQRSGKRLRRTKLVGLRDLGRRHVFADKLNSSFSRVITDELCNSLRLSEVIANNPRVSLCSNAMT